MPHPIVDQLAFARTELVRSLDGVTAEEARQRLMPMNSIGWIVGHLADQEQRYFLQRQGHPLVVDGLNDLVGYGKPATTPELSDMWATWKAITAATEPVLAAMAPEDLLIPPAHGEPPVPDSNGTLILRVTYHYWYHLGEGQAIRQILGHPNLPDFVGDIGKQAPFRLV
jgi:hypothetical protein